MDDPPRTVMACQSNVSGDQGLPIAPPPRCDTELQQLKPAAPSIPAAPTTFYNFSRLPAELRQMIWERCLPQMIVQPWYDGPLATRRPHTYPLIASVNREALQVAVRLGWWTRVTVRPYDELFGWLPYRRRGIWLNKKDVVYLGVNGCKPLLFEFLDGLHGNGITRPAQNPATQLMISCRLCNLLHWPRNREYREGQPLNMKHRATPAGKILYEKFLKRRKSFLLEIFHIEVLLEGPARENAIRAGMFGLWGDEPAIVDAADITTLHKYKDLLEPDTGIYAIDRTTDADILYGVHVMDGLDIVHDENIDYDHFSYDGGATPARFMRMLLHALGNVAEVKFDWDSVVGRNGKVNNDHPMLKRLGLSLPDWTPVIVFELLSEEDTRRARQRMPWMYKSVVSEDEETDEKENDG